MEEDNQDSVPLTNEMVDKKKFRFGSSMEMLMFMFFVAKTFSDTVVVNLMEKSTCLVILNYDVANCTEPVSSTTEGEMQQSAASLLMVRSMTEAFVPSLLTLFIGPWSDTNGRRPLMVLSLIGFMISAGLWCGLSLIPGLHPVFFLVPSVPIALCGGYSSFFLGVYCYVIDITELEQRAFRMGRVEAACLGGLLFSSIVTPYLLQTSDDYGFTIVFATGFVLLLLTFLYTYFWVPESVNIVESERTRLWKFDHVKEIFTTCFRERPNYTRSIVLIICMNLVLFVLIMQGEMSVTYMFTQTKFQWDLVAYTRFASFYILVAGLAVIVSTWFFSSFLKFADLPLMFVGTLCMTGKGFVEAIASRGLYFYMASGFNIMSIMITPLSRSQLSKLIPPEDLGKVFAFTAFLEATSPLMASPLYTFVYKNTLDTMPSAVFWLSTGLSYVSVLMIGSALILHRLSFPPSFTSIPNEVSESSIQD